MQFIRGEDSFIEYMIGYFLTANVFLNVETGLFESVKGKTAGTTMDPTEKALLENEQKLIESLSEQVHNLTSAPPKSVMSIPHLSLKSMQDSNVAYNHPE